MSERFAGVDVEVGAIEFAQINRAQAARLYARVAELAAPARRAVDLYTGLGGVALHLAAAGIAVTSPSTSIAPRWPRSTMRGDARGPAGDGDRRRRRPHRRRRRIGAVDVAVVDPPRRGLGEAGRALARRRSPPPRVVAYISCGVESLALDLEAVRRDGYGVDAVEAFDLMPGTAQVETVVRLVREI